MTFSTNLSHLWLQYQDSKVDRRLFHLYNCNEPSVLFRWQGIVHHQPIGYVRLCPIVVRSVTNLSS